MANDQIDALLLPFSEDNPVGDDPRSDRSPTSLYTLIKDARNSARAAERQSLFDSEADDAKSHWRKVIEQAPELLSTQAKDLEIACWYTEALIRLQGFTGLSQGFLLIQSLIEKFWDGLYPLPDEDGIETRVAPLTGLNGEGAEGVLIAPIRNTFITENDDPGPFNLWNYQQALEANKIVDEEAKKARIAKNGYDVSDIESAVAQSSDDFFQKMHEHLTLCIETYKNIGRQLDEHCGIHDSPPISNIINVLTECLGAVNHLAKDKLNTSQNDEDTMQTIDGESSNNDDNTHTATSTHIGGPVQSRESALKQISLVSDYFEKTEPHSPVSYLLKKAVRWGNMPLDELMKELIPDNASLNHYMSFTGIKSDAEN